jgi:hypothetical protein
MSLACSADQVFPQEEGSRWHPTAKMRTVRIHMSSKSCGATFSRSSTYNPNVSHHSFLLRLPSNYMSPHRH